MEKTFCAVCAWRKDCKKKFLSSSSANLQCPDFTRDLSIKEEKEVKDLEKSLKKDESKDQTHADC